MFEKTCKINLCYFHKVLFRLVVHEKLMKTANSLYKVILLYFLFDYENSTYTNTYMSFIYIKNLK